MSSVPLDSYHVGILCALPLEKAAVEAALDEEHDRPDGIPKKDEHSYTFGRIGDHHVVIACLPDGMTGKASAATVGTDVMRTFPIKVGLMVGIGGGAPSKNHDIRLGDVVVGRPQGTDGGVVQYDFGKELPNGFARTGALNKPPSTLLSALSGLRAKHERPKWNKISQHLAKITEEMDERYQFQGVQNDVLFESTYDHVGGPETACDETRASEHCDLSRVVHRSERKNPEVPFIHYGTIASADKVMRHGPERDRIATELGALCFEMEAAGLDENFRCIVIRGICDYSDSHKNKRWQRYAASTAAAFAKEFLSFVLPQGLEELRPAGEPKNTLSYMQAVDHSKATGALPAPSKKVPFSSKGVPMINDFVPRDEAMEQLQSYFLSEDNTVKAGRKTFVVHGMGGIGKTQLCVEFTRRNKTRFDSIFWLNGSSFASLQHSFAEAASRALGILVKRDFSMTKAQDSPLTPTESSIRGIVKQFLSWLSDEENNNWLLIFDNIDDNGPIGYDLEDLLPDCDHGNVLVTTRLSNLLRSKKRLHLDKVNDAQALRILETRAGKPLKNVQPLIDRLGGLPLALAQAGCYLRRPLTVEKYLEMYEQVWTRLMHSQQEFSHDDYLERSLLTTWVLSYEQVVRESPAAAGLLRLWAYLDNSDIWFDLLAISSSKIVEKRWPMWYSSLVHDELTFHDRMNALLVYSLASISANGQGYSMHKVVHDWTRHQIGDANDRSELFQMAIYLVGSKGIDADVDLERRLLPHARHQAKNIQSGCDKQSIESLNTIAKLLDGWEESTMSVILYEHILAVCQAALGPDHDWTLRTLNIAADVMSKAGLQLEASVYYVRALNGYRARYGQKHAEFLDTLHRLAVLMRERGTFVGARDLYDKVLEGYKEIYGPNHEKTYLIAYDVAKICDEPSQVKELLALSLEGKRHCLGATHWMTLENMYQLGWLYFQLGKITRAEMLWLEALDHHVADESAQKLLETKYILPTLWSLSRMYIRQKRLPDAELTLLRLKDIIALQFGPRHAALTAPMHLLSWAYRHQIKLHEAEETLTDLLDMHAEDHGVDNEDSYNMRLELALVYLRSGKLVAALRSFERAVEISDSRTDAMRGLRHVQRSIAYCKNKFISESELQSVLASLGYPEHSDQAIQKGLLALIARRAQEKEHMRISYRSKIPVSKKTKQAHGSSPAAHQTSTNTEGSQHDFRARNSSATRLTEANTSKSDASLSTVYCDGTKDFFCHLFASHSKRITKRFLDFWQGWVVSWSPELLPSSAPLTTKSPFRPSRSWSRSIFDRSRGRPMSSINDERYNIPPLDRKVPHSRGDYYNERVSSGDSYIPRRRRRSYSESSSDLYMTPEDKKVPQTAPDGALVPYTGTRANLNGDVRLENEAGPEFEELSSVTDLDETSPYVDQARNTHLPKGAYPGSTYFPPPPNCDETVHGASFVKSKNRTDVPRYPKPPPISAMSAFSPGRFGDFAEELYTTPADQRKGNSYPGTRKEATTSHGTNSPTRNSGRPKVDLVIKKESSSRQNAHARPKFASQPSRQAYVEEMMEFDKDTYEDDIPSENDNSDGMEDALTSEPEADGVDSPTVRYAHEAKATTPPSKTDLPPTIDGELYQRDHRYSHVEDMEESDEESDEDDLRVGRPLAKGEPPLKLSGKRTPLSWSPLLIQLRMRNRSSILKRVSTV